MANALTAGTIQIGSNVRVAGATIAPQGTAASVTLDSPSADANGAGQQVFAFGTASGQVDIICAADYDLATTASVTIDIYASGLLNLFGGAADFRKLKVVWFGIVSGGDAAGATIGNAASNAHQLFFGAQNDTWTVFPANQGVPLAGSSLAGVTVDATHRNVKLLNNSAISATVRLILGGTSV